MLRWIGLGLTCAFLLACGGDDEEGGGKAGTGGKDAGTGGTSATGGSGGTSATGGTGGTSASGGTGGSSGSGGGCTDASECPATGNECANPTCDNGVCGTEPVPSGTVITTQAPGDCKRVECDGAGSTQEVNDDDDVDDDGKECTTDTCASGTPASTPVMIGTTCESTKKCDALGDCVDCVAASDCGTASECAAPLCTNGVCDPGLVAANTPVAIQIDGDCKKVVCDGAGAQATQEDLGDVEDDQQPCTTDTCSATGPVHTPTPGVPCGTAGICNASGQCVGCNTAADCQGTDDFCKTKTCVNNVCGVSFTGTNTPLPAADQSTGDCASKVCNGSGDVTTIAAPTDLPVDGNACTLDQCVGGSTPQNPPAPSGATCSSGGGTVCNGNGSCVQCVNATQCGTPAVCNTKSCVANQCVNGFSPSTQQCGGGTCASGTAQLPDFCNGSGTCVDAGTESCSPYVCGPAACTGSCSSDAGCSGGAICDTGLATCVPNGPTCTNYCNTIAADCLSPYAQYFSMQACLESCKFLPKGAQADTGGNTVGCRTYHANNALVTGNQAVHCPHAGPGGDGACGANCAGFCAIALGACTGANQIYSSLSQCMTDCATFPTSPKYSSTVTSGNSFACRMYHLTNATLDPSVHCSHINSASPTCQ